MYVKLSCLSSVMRDEEVNQSIKKKKVEKELDVLTYCGTRD